MNNTHAINHIKPTKSTTNPKKLLHSKWTALQVMNKEKHIIVTQMIFPDVVGEPISLIELEAVYSRRSQRLPWQTLNDRALWQQGWVW